MYFCELDIRSMNKFEPYAPCICDSGDKAKFCCLKSGKWNKAPANINPLPPCTMFANDQCYASITNDCNSKISKEHYLSRSVLQQLGQNNEVKISGLHWQKAETFSKMAIDRLIAKILCERHNNALSPLDAEFSRLQASTKVSRNEQNSRLSNDRSFLFSGEDIERWLMKSLIGLVFARNLDASSLRKGAIAMLYGLEKLPPGAGLYVTSAAIYQNDSLEISMLENPSTGQILAMRCDVGSLVLELALGEVKSDSGYGLYIPARFHRPSCVSFNAAGAEHRLELTWNDGLQHVPLSFERTGEFSGPPPHWQEWQKNG